MNEFEQHDAIWDDRLQDLLDGDVELSTRAGTETHISTCARCRRRYAKLKRVDAQLTAKLHPPHLDAAFDRQIFARIETLETHGRDHARRRAELELQQNLAALSRDWRRGVALLLGGAVAGIAMALAFIAWADSSGITQQFLGALVSFGPPEASLRSAMTAFVGALVGIGISGCVARSMR